MLKIVVAVAGKPFHTISPAYDALPIPPPDKAQRPDQVATMGCCLAFLRSVVHTTNSYVRWCSVQICSGCPPAHAHAHRDNPRTTPCAAHNRYKNFATLERTLGKAIDASVEQKAEGGDKNEQAILSSIFKLFVQVHSRGSRHSTPQTHHPRTL